MWSVYSSIPRKITQEAILTSIQGHPSSQVPLWPWQECGRNPMELYHPSALQKPGLVLGSSWWSLGWRSMQSGPCE